MNIEYFIISQISREITTIHTLSDFIHASCNMKKKLEKIGFQREKRTFEMPFNAIELSEQKRKIVSWCCW